MPLTLTDAARLSRDMLVRGVIETIIEESAVLRYLPFVSVVGNSLRYNQEVTLGDVDFYAVGDIWAESATTVAEKTANLSILGGDADVDAFLQQTYSDPNDLRALVVSAKARSLAHTLGIQPWMPSRSTACRSFPRERAPWPWAPTAPRSTSTIWTR